MKKLILIVVLLSTCSPNYLYTLEAQNKSKESKTAQQSIDDAWEKLAQSKDTTATIITDIKRLAKQKIIYRTKLIERRDTVWRIDTCITVITPIDSATIAILFKNRDTPKVTKVGRIIRYIFHSKNKK